MAKFDRAVRQEVMEILGAVAIVASLIFVGLEVRQAREIARADVYQQRTQMELDIRRDGLDQAALLSAELISYGDYGSMTPEQRRAFSSHYNMWILWVENAYFQYQHGLLTDEEWDNQVELLVVNLTRRPCMRNVWGNGILFRESFRNLVNGMLEDAKIVECPW